MNVKPTRDRVVVRILESEKASRGGIIIPDVAAKERPTAEVVAAGPGRRTSDGVLIPLEIKVGDRVMFADSAGHAVKIDGNDYRVLKEEDIIAVVE